MLKRLRLLLALPGRYYVWGSLLIMGVTIWAISAQIGERRGFAGGELHRDVMDRWGAPVLQASPSVRYVESGAVFTSLRPLVLRSQAVHLDAAMNYRKRGLVYFSGFDFAFSGRYELENTEEREIDVVFVFPVQHARQTIISDLGFSVNGAQEPLPLSATRDKLTWTGRLAPGQSTVLEIGFRGRGLDSFTYRADPELPVRNLTLDIEISGGENYDYAAGVLPANKVETDEERVRLHWAFDSLEAGFPFGVILPSERSFDAIILIMIRRSWATFLLFLAGTTGLALFLGRPLARYEAYLLSAAYAFFFVLVPYLSAYMHFYLAYGASLLVVGGLLQLYLLRTLGAGAGRPVLLLIVGLLVVPTLAVLLQRHTGLIYSIEILVGLAALMGLTRRRDFRRLLDEVEDSLRVKETANAL